MIALAVAGLFVGKYPLNLQQLLAGEELQWRVFVTLRWSRTLVGVVGGFALGVAGFVYQTVFRNPLASPDIIGVSSGASAGAAAGILFLSGTASVTLSAFGGAVLAVILALALSGLDRSGKNSTIVLSGIAVHSLAQTLLMCLKLTADPERELASIEYWIMGSLSGISLHTIGGNLTVNITGGKISQIVTTRTDYEKLEGDLTVTIGGTGDEITSIHLQGPTEVVKVYEI
jgi:iron complex transport system permease protein